MNQLEEFVAKSHIIKELGGDEDWAYHFVEPVPGENSRMDDEATKQKLLAERETIVQSYEKATLEWIAGRGTEIKSQRNAIANELKEDYWRLDPYVRARTVYDRTGIIQPGGGLNFYPSKADAAASLPVETHPDLD